MIWRRSVPEVLRPVKGRLLGHGSCADGRVVGVYRDFLALAGSDVDTERHDVRVYDWTEIASARWEHTSQTVFISFIDSSVPALSLKLEQGKSEDVAPLIHERVDSSFFWRHKCTLPSGADAFFMIRSGRGSQLSIQALYGGVVSEEDADFIESMYARMRDLANIAEENS
ncbi:MAG: hypothetical protein IKZ87_06675 [Actinomycetaceae bacterium]|nr:hypothetical protein [Actinomycetaceae bacterium]